MKNVIGLFSSIGRLILGLRAGKNNTWKTLEMIREIYRY